MFKYIEEKIVNFEKRIYLLANLAAKATWGPILLPKSKFLIKIGDFKDCVIKSFCLHKNLFFFYNFPFFIWFISLVDIVQIKPAPGDQESNFKKRVQSRVGAIPSEPWKLYLPRYAAFGYFLKMFAIHFPCSVSQPFIN